MKNTRTLCTLFGLVFVVVPSVLADTSITTVPFTIKNVGVYVLTKNLTYAGTGNAIEVEVPDVTIDFQGYRIECPSQPGNAVGVYVDTVSDVTVGISTDGYCYWLENYVVGIGSTSKGIQTATTDKYRFNVVMNTGTSYVGGTALTDDNN
jgi:hypothetical protein